MDQHIENLIKQYEKKRPLYEDFCFAVNKLLADYLDKNNYKCQIFYRVKSLPRLSEKLYRKKHQHKIYKKLYEVEDLAGIRLIFYLESDKENFLKNFNNPLFKIVEIKNLKKEGGYKAKHLVILLNGKLLRNRKLRRFKNLRCEIQLISIFGHAWAELEHDWIYKDICGLKIANPQKYHFIKCQMKHIFEKYIKKASLKFERVARALKKSPSILKARK